MKGFPAISVVICLIWSNLAASEYRIMSEPVVADDSFTAGAVIGKVSSAERIPMVLPPGTVIDSSYWDWQRNACLNRRVWVNADGSVHATYMKSPDQGFASRGMYYYYADPFGGDFTSFGDVAVFRNGYGNLAAYPTTHEQGAIAVVTTHNYETAESFVFVDQSQGTGNFTMLETNSADSVVWPKPTVNSDGSINIIGTLIDGMQVDFIDHNVASDRAPDVASGFTQTWRWMGGDSAGVWAGFQMEFPAAASGANRNVGVVIGDYAADIHFLKSTNGGGSFVRELLTDARFDTLGVPQDPDSSATVFLPWINWDIVYTGEEPHIVWTGLQAGNFGGIVLYDYRTRILHWSPSTGIDTVVVSPYQGAIPSDSSFVIGGRNHTSIDWPQIGTSPDGDVFYVVYVGFNPNDIDTTNGIGFGDIWGLFSTDYGETWSDPINITNPGGMYPGTDDRYPSISPVNHEAAIEPGMDAYIVYQTDNTAGSYLHGEEEANQDFLIFKGIDFSGVGIGEGDSGKIVFPRAFTLHQNYPNPFNPSTTLSFEVAGSDNEKQNVNLAIYDIRGRLVRRLIDSKLEPGSQEIHWDGRDDRGQSVATGIYLYTLRAGEERFTRKLTILK